MIKTTNMWIHEEKKKDNRVNIMHQNFPFTSSTSKEQRENPHTVKMIMRTDFELP